MRRYDSTTVIVTGGTGGQGTSHVRAYHRQGANVVVAGLDDAAGEALAAELGDRALAVHLDVTRPEDWDAAVAAAQRRFGGVDVLVNNAGIQHAPVTIQDTDPEVWRRTLDVNLTGAFLGIRAVAPVMRRRGGGAIVMIGSTMGHVGTSRYAPYTASKWAVRGLTRTAALELGRDGIRVTCIEPGVIATPLVLEPNAPGQRAIADVYSPEPFAVPRMGEPEDVTRLLLFLTSTDASFITGSEHVVDGGLLLGPALDPEAA